MSAARCSRSLYATRQTANRPKPLSKRLDALRRDYIKVLKCFGTRATPAPPPDNGPSLEDLLNG